MKKNIILFIIAILFCTSCSSHHTLRTNADMQTEMDERAQAEQFSTFIPNIEPDPICLQNGHEALIYSHNNPSYEHSLTQHWTICKYCREPILYEDHYTYSHHASKGVIFNDKSYLYTKENCICGFVLGASMKYLTGGDTE